MLKVEGNWNARASLQHRSGAEARLSGTPRPFYPVFHTREIAPITGPIPLSVPLRLTLMSCNSMP